MNKNNEYDTCLERLSDTVELLDNSSRQLVSIMEEQIDAIIASDTQRIEALTDVHTTLSWNYKKNENEFITELGSLMEEMGTDKADNLRLVKLKEYFPGWADEIDTWHSVLTENTIRLQQKHSQVIELLEFAMKQNARLMHSMYSQHNEKNTRYVASGKQSDIVTGVAVNQEV